QPACDRVFAVARFHDEGKVLAVRASATPGVLLDLGVAPAEHGAGLIVASAPAADADHLVVLEPVGKRVVGSVHANKAPALADVLLKRLLRRLGPLVVAVVGEHDVIAGEL